MGFAELRDISAVFPWCCSLITSHNPAAGRIAVSAMHCGLPKRDTAISDEAKRKLDSALRGIEMRETCVLQCQGPAWKTQWET